MISGGSNLVLMVDLVYFVQGKTSVRFITSNYSIYATTSLIERKGSYFTIIAPPSPYEEGEGIVWIDISYEGEDSVSNFVSFSYIKKLVIRDIYPRRVEKYVDTTIQIFGDGFGSYRGDLQLICKFGNLQTVGIWQSPHILTCTIPTQHELRCITVEISTDNIGFVQSPHQLCIRESPKVLRVIPLIGPARGNSPIAIYGERFHDELGCSFGNEFSSAVMKNESYIECMSPPMRVLDSIHFSNESLGLWQKSFILSSNGHNIKNAANNISFNQFSLWKKEFLFTYYTDEVIDSIVPLIGPARGGTKLRLSGIGFIDTQVISCRIGNSRPILATYISETVVECVTPSIEETTTNVIDDSKLLNNGKVLISVANNGIDFGSQSTSLSAYFTYYEKPSISQFSPRSGIPGTSILINIISLPILENPKCKFKNITVTAKFIPPSSLQCDAPMLSINGVNISELDIIEPILVEISFNGIDFEQYENILFSYSNAPMPYKILPELGPARGGNTVSIFGINFNLRSKTFCRFGSITTTADVLAQDHLICIAPPHKSGPVIIRLLEVEDTQSDDRTTVPGLFVNTTESNLKDEVVYSFVDDLMIFDVIPRHGAIVGGTLITVRGSFFPTISLICMFDNQIVESMWKSTNEIQCQTPPQPFQEMRSVSLNIGVPGILKPTILSTNAAQFVYTPVPFIKKIYPERGIRDGGENITIIGGNFFQFGTTDEVLCGVGDKVVSCIYLSNQTIQCRSPQRQAIDREVQRVSLKYDNSSQKSSNFTLSFMGEETVQLNILSPTEDILNALKSLSNVGDLGITGNHKIYEEYMHSALFLQEYNITFTTMGSPSNVGDLPLIEVRTQNIQANVNRVNRGCCPVRVSTNLIDFYGGINNSDIHYVYDERSVIRIISPAHGTSNGGTLVQLTGSGFVPPGPQMKLFCIFGSKYVAAQYVDSTKVICISPAHSICKVVVSVKQYSMTGASGPISESLAIFEFVEDIQVHSIVPRNLPFLKGEHTYEFTIYGSHFQDYPSLSCAFAKETIKSSLLNTTIVVRGRYINSKKVKCEIRDIFVKLNEPLIISVSTNRKDWSNSLHVPIVPMHSVSSIFPTSGSRYGGTKVRITGKKFIKSDTLACKFNYVTTNAIFLTQDYIYCIAPPYQKIMGSTNVNLMVTNNGHQFSSEIFNFQYYDNWNFKLVGHNFGPRNGGTLITLVQNDTIGTSDLHPSTKYSMCKFNNTVVPLITTNNASIATCTSPPALDSKGGLVKLEFSKNSVDFSSEGHTFFYLPDQIQDLVSLHPSHGPVSFGIDISILLYFFMKVFLNYELLTTRRKMAVLW